MAVFELVSGDFEPEQVRVRYSEAGRALLRLTSTDGRVEDVFLETDVVGVAESGEGPIGEHLARWAEGDGFDLLPPRPERRGSAARRRDGRGRRLFAVVLRDGRRFVGLGTGEAIAELKAWSLPAELREATGEPAAERFTARRVVAEVLPRFVPGLLARLRPPR